MSRSQFKFLRRVRIHDGECGAVARALHHETEGNYLSAVGRKVLSTTNERKVMSKTTFFKRIALTAIAALGLGMLSVAPSQAAAGAPTLSVTAGSASVTAGANNETTTAATVRVSGLLSETYDSYSVRMTVKTAGGTATQFYMATMDTGTYVNSRVSAAATGASPVDYEDYVNSGLQTAVNYDSATVGTTRWLTSAASGGSYVSATFGLLLDSHTARTAAMAGTYVYTAIVTPYSAAVAGTPVTADLTFTINPTAAVAAATNGTIDPSKTTAYLGSGTTVPGADGTNITAVSTAATTTRATLAVRTYTSASLQAPESVTVTITGPGLVGTSAGVYGKSITVAADGAQNFLIRSDGTAGTASIVVSTTTVTFAAKTMTFYAAKASTVEASVVRPVIGLSTTNDVVRATFKDASGNVWAGAAYIYASTAADALIGGSNATPVACTWAADDNRHECPVTGITSGTANFKVIDAATVALATTTSSAVAVRVSTGIATTAVLSFDKATYAPGEKAQLRVQVLDGAGLAMPGGDIASGLATGGIVSSKAFGSGSATITGTTLAVSGETDASADLNAGHVTYVVYMPLTAGVVTVSATGGTGLASAGRVAITGSATVEVPADPEVVAAKAAADAATDAALEAIDAANAATDAANLAAEAADAATVAAEEARDAADAATAAVEALATEVATLMAALKAQITTLANTVAKIAKKVKA